jgi:hypothetical protein
MNKRPGHVKVTTETGYCSFCGRARNLRREEHQLGTFVRTVVTCETCHRTLSSTMGVAAVETAASEAPSEKPAPVAATVASTPPAKRAVAAKTKPPPSAKPKATKPRATRTK